MSTGGHYFITFYYKGEKNYTGAYIGYERSDREEIY